MIGTQPVLSAANLEGTEFSFTAFIKISLHAWLKRGQQQSYLHVKISHLYGKYGTLLQRSGINEHMFIDDMDIGFNELIVITKQLQFPLQLRCNKVLLCCSSGQQWL